MPQNAFYFYFLKAFLKLLYSFIVSQKLLIHIPVPSFYHLFYDNEYSYSELVFVKILLLIYYKIISLSLHSSGNTHMTSPLTFI
jgi:hypothetical protein